MRLALASLAALASLLAGLASPIPQGGGTCNPLPACRRDLPEGIVAESSA
ncbi:hypothetical protein AURDEDRAFT_160303 [Auricularia subglabra TFB-10046 SS5]|nr:hypothetical protein AURDEDRAFT_160303 [Auricularia subglabra TFB-10046 SS5]